MSPHRWQSADALLLLLMLSITSAYTNNKHQPCTCSPEPNSKFVKIPQQPTPKAIIAITISVRNAPPDFNQGENLSAPPLLLLLLMCQLYYS